MKKKKVHKVVVHNVVNFAKKPQLADFLCELRVVVRVCESVFVSLFGVWKYCAVGRVMGSVEKYWGHRNKNIKKQPFSDASASHLSLVLWYV